VEAALYVNLTEVYEAFASAERALLQEQARTNLLRQGFKKEFLLDPLVKREVFRLLEAQTGTLEEEGREEE
jgi:hypothetical protein